MLLAARHTVGVPSDLRPWLRRSQRGDSCGLALRDAVASAVASAADFELGSAVVTISEVPADKMKPAGSSDQ
jgi:hypothetical protein